MAQRATVEPMRRPNRIPPHNLDAEQSVLGAMMESKEAIANVVEILSPGDFYKPAHGEIFETIVALDQSSEAVDAITVADELARRDTLEQVGGKPYLLGLIEAYPTASSAAYYARIVEELSILRSLVGAGNEIQDIGFAMPEDVSAAVDEAEEIIYKVGDRRLRDDVHHVRPLLSESMKAIEDIYTKGANITGLASGFFDLDDMTAGFQPGNLVIIAARPSMGKSSMLNDFALTAALRQNQPVVIFSLEMSKLELVSRFLSSEGKVDMQRIKKGTLQEQDWTRLSSAVGRLAEAPIYIDDSANVTLMEMRAKCRRLKAKHGLGLIIIDYLQLMQSPRRSENRQQEVSEISRGLKLLAKELMVPVLCASQLNRGVEYRADKRPLLGDLRESGCLTGETRITLADGSAVPIADLVGSTPEILTLDGWQIRTGKASKVWRVGRKPVFKLTLASGRTIRATHAHPFLKLDGWMPLGNLQPGDRVGVTRNYPYVPTDEWDPRHLVLLAHLIGDGSFLRNLPLRYASVSEENLQAVADAAKAFDVTAHGKYEPQARCTQYFLPAPYHLTHGRRNPIVKWLDELGLYDRRSHQKFVPAPVFTLPPAQIALFLKHLWATDGCVWMRPEDQRGPRGRIYYATNSPQLARDVQGLLARLDIFSRISSHQKAGYRPGLHITITGADDQRRFLEVVGGYGPRRAHVEAMRSALSDVKANTNRDTIPVEVWDRVKAKMKERGITHRQMAAMRGSTYGGSSHFKFAPSRNLLAQYAELLDDVELKELANSDVYWDSVVSIEPDGEEDVFDMTVPGTHNFEAAGLISHNSIEQDSDMVMFIYRDEVYNQDSEAKGEAELIVAKHRNGPTGIVRLAFMNQYTKFASIAKGPL